MTIRLVLVFNEQPWKLRLVTGAVADLVEVGGLPLPGGPEFPGQDRMTVALSISLGLVSPAGRAHGFAPVALFERAAEDRFRRMLVGMRRSDVIAKLQSQKESLLALGVGELYLFGSVARDEARDDSDVDLLVEFTGPPSFDRFMDLKFFLEGTLGITVDLVTRRALKTGLRTEIERDAVRVA